ncbi:MAG TPA: hypothetical protein VM451_04740 [Candidatus Limnocylindria bacterium]|nr:hypothetical protein [Candidatus Limnocylindria bacterium]
MDKQLARLLDAHDEASDAYRTHVRSGIVTYWEGDAPPRTDRSADLPWEEESRRLRELRDQAERDLMEYVNRDR